MIDKPFRIWNLFPEEDKSLNEALSFINHYEKKKCKDCGNQLSKNNIMIKCPKYLILCFDKEEPTAYKSVDETIKIHINNTISTG